MTEIEIKYESYNGLRCISRSGKTLTVLCVDHKEYKRTFKNAADAKDNMGSLVAIVVEWGWKVVK